MFLPQPLKFKFEEYEPFISKEIMELHYSKHYLTYLKNLNSAIEKYPENFNLKVSKILENIKELPEDIRSIVRNNGGGVVNHEILGDTLSNKETSIHEGKLKNDIEKKFSSLEKFKDEFVKVGSTTFGSGGVWLVLDDKKDLKIYSTPNQDSPFMDGYFPIFGIDIGEHAYYLQYKNVRTEYIKEIGKILDGHEIEKRYLSILS